MDYVIDTNLTIDNKQVGKNIITYTIHGNEFELPQGWFKVTYKDLEVFLEVTLGDMSFHYLIESGVVNNIGLYEPYTMDTVYTLIIRRS